MHRLSTNIVRSGAACSCRISPALSFFQSLRTPPTRPLGTCLSLSALDRPNQSPAVLCPGTWLDTATDISPPPLPPRLRTNQSSHGVAAGSRCRCLVYYAIFIPFESTSQYSCYRSLILCTPQKLVLPSLSTLSRSHVCETGPARDG
jgi:hypothetical protein